MGALSRNAKYYLWAMLLAGGALFVWKLVQQGMNDLWYILALCGVAFLTLLLREKVTPERRHYDLKLVVYSFSFILLGPSATLWVILLSGLIEWLWFRPAWYLQGFEIAVNLLGVYLAGLLYLWTKSGEVSLGLVSLVSGLAAMWILALVTHVLNGLLTVLNQGQSLTRSAVFELAPLIADFTLLCIGAGTAYIWEINPIGAVWILLPLYLFLSFRSVSASQEQSLTDPKTGLYNAAYFEQILWNELKRANRYDRSLVLAMVELELIQDERGLRSAPFDRLLQEIANVLRSSLREYDVVARYDEHRIVLLMAETRLQAAYPRLQALLNLAEKGVYSQAAGNPPAKVKLKFGLACRERFDQTPQDLLQMAERTLALADQDENPPLSKGAQAAASGHADLEPGPSSMVELDNEREGMPDDATEQIASRTEWIGDEMRQATSRASLAIESLAGGELDETPRSLSRYIFALGVAALIAFGLTFQMPADVDWVGLAVFVLLVGLTEWFSIDFSVRDLTVSASAVPMLAGILLLGPLGAVTLSFTYATVLMFKKRGTVEGFVFDFSSQMIAAFLYTSLFKARGIVFVALPPETQFWLSLAAMGVVYLSTTFMTAVYLGLARTLSIREVWRAQFSWLAPYYFALGLIAFMLVYGFQTAGFLGTLVVFVPILILRFSLTRFVDHTSSELDRLRNVHIELEQDSAEKQALIEGLLDTLAQVADLRDLYELGHSRRVAHYASLIAGGLGLPAKRVALVQKAALLHDLGKLAISEKILHKPGKLSLEEYNIVKDHVVIGAEILGSSHALEAFVPIVRHHHERYDGLGYPDGLKGSDIPIEARVLNVAETIEAMSTDQPYRGGFNTAEMITELEKCSGSQFDPQVVKVAVEILEAEERAGKASVTAQSRIPRDI